MSDATLWSGRLDCVAAGGTNAAAGRRQEVTEALWAALGGLGFFFVFDLAIHYLGWHSVDLAGLVSVYATLFAANVALLAQGERWFEHRGFVYAYEGLHVLAVTVLLYYLGGTQTGIIVIVYALLVVHTKMLQPDASTFVTANAGAICFGVFAVLEGFGYVEARNHLNSRLSPLQRVAMVTWNCVALNFLALYTMRWSRQLQCLTERLRETIGDRTAANAAVATKARALAEKQEELQTFLYNVTHDLKAPVSSTVLMARLLLERGDGILDPALRGEISRIFAAAAKAEDMIRDLFGVFRVTSTAEPMVRVDLNQLVAKVTAELQPQITEKQLRVEFSRLPVVRGEARKLGCVVHNLMSNAVKYTRLGGWIRVNGELNGSFALLRVEDNGLGIPVQYHRHIFDLFGRVPHLDGEPSASGSGVGLALVKRIVESHGGSVSVRSSPGQGSCFHVRLPIGQETMST